MKIKVTEVRCFECNIDEQYFIDKIQLLIDSGLHLQKGDIFDVENLLEENADYINYKVKGRQIFVSSENIEVMYYIELLFPYLFE
jgi:hypothetical protein